MTHEGIDVLDRSECYTLLRTQRLGRVALKLGDELVILPVYYAVLDDDVVFRTSPGMKLDAAVLRTTVAFEVDDEVPAPGWSVLVSGHVQELRGAREEEAARTILGHDWPEGEREHIVRLRAEKVTGRRLRTINLV
jgi:nitroimidazol reductase NimA-like FMN-containing flavoprotein (pyridoxamine 5'-phosphate oxidase superfamily)